MHRNIARGVLFALPGLFYFVVEPMFPSRTAPVALLLAVMAGWGISQVMAIVGHTLIGRGNRSGAGKALALILIGGLAAMAAAGGLAATVTGWNHNLVAASLPRPCTSCPPRFCCCSSATDCCGSASCRACS